MSFPKKVRASKRSLSDSEMCPTDREDNFRINSKTPNLNLPDKPTMSSDDGPKQKDLKLPDESANEEVISRKALEECGSDDEVNTEKHSISEREETNEITQSEKNDILEEMLKSSQSSSEELEKAETLELSIDDSNLDGCDSSEEKKKPNCSVLKGKSKARPEEGEREEGELTPDHHCSVDETSKAPDVKEVKSSHEKENVPKENLQDILGSFYKNAKEFMETQNDHLQSSLLARLNWIIRHVEDVKGEISREDLFSKELRKAKQSRSVTRQGMSDVNRSRASNQRSRSITADKKHGAIRQGRSSDALRSKPRRDSPTVDKSCGLSEKETRSAASRSVERRHQGTIEAKEKLQKSHFTKNEHARKGDDGRHAQRGRFSRTHPKAPDDPKPRELDTRKEAREKRHSQNRKEQNRVQSLVKRQMKIISHIVKKQNKAPLKRETDAWSRYSHAISRDQKHRRKETRDSEPQSPLRDRPLKNLDDMEAFLDDLRSKNRSQNAGTGIHSRHLSILDKELSNLTNVFEGAEQFLSRDDMDIYKYKYVDENHKKSMMFTSKKGDRSKINRPTHDPLKVIGEAKQNIESQNNDGQRDCNWRLLQSNTSQTQQSSGILCDEIKENITQSASEQRALKRKALLEEKNEIIQKVSEKREEEKKSRGEELYNPSDVTDDDSIPEHKGSESRNEISNKRSISSEPLTESDEEIRMLEKTRRLSGTENSSSGTEDEPHGKRITGKHNKIKRREHVPSSSKRKPKSLSMRKIRKRVKDDDSLPRRSPKSRSKGVLKPGRRIILADKNLAGRICLQMQSGHIYLTNAKEVLERKRGIKIRSGKRIRKNLRRNEMEFRSESKRNGTRRKNHCRGETTLEEMESFLEQLRERREADARTSEGEPMQLNVPDKEAKFLDRVRAKRKAKLMACLDANVSRQTVAKEAKCLENMYKRVGDGSDEDDNSSAVNEKDKSELLQKLKAETKAILLGNKSKPREGQRQVLEQQ